MVGERPSSIDATLIHTVLDRLDHGKAVRRILPEWGRIHIDRRLPFLFVYRKPPRRPDEGTDRLVLGEAAYIRAPGHRRFFPGLSLLVESLARASVDEFGAFLLVEVWSDEDGRGVGTESLDQPAFRVRHRGAPALSPTVEAFEEALGRIRMRRLRSAVDSVVEKRIAPPGLFPLMSEDLLAIRGTHVLGLEVRPIYRRDQANVFPVVLRELHRAVSRSTKRALVGFVRTRTRYQPAHPQMLGRRAVVKAVWEVDRVLAQVSDAFDFLLCVTPVNAHGAWTAFERNREQKAPRFGYRPLPISPGELKRKLYSAPLERIEDPELAWIFRQKQIELDRRLTALYDRDTPQFVYGSLQIFGGADDALVGTATNILDKIPARARERRGRGTIDAAAFAKRARREIESFRIRYPDARASVEITDRVTGLMVSQGKLLISPDLNIAESRLEALIQHEVGTHILTWINGRAQPFRLLDAGLAGYDELQEGLAVLSEHLVGGLSAPRLRLLAARVVAVRHMLGGATFVDTFRELDRRWEFSKATAWGVTMRVFRGGGLTKDASYLRGLVRLMEYVHGGGKLDPLLVGKIGADDVPVISELLRRKVLREPPLRPRYLEDTKALARLRAASETATLLDLLVDGATRRRRA
jgi:uncharacterized protein (TIGR02421 family)